MGLSKSFTKCLELNDVMELTKLSIKRVGFSEWLTKLVDRSKSLIKWVEFNG